MGGYLLWLKFHLARLDSTHSTCRAHAFGCVELVEECTARLARHVELDRRYLQLSYDHRNSFIV